MKRDMDAIRQILLAARESSTPLSQLSGMDDAVFCHNVGLLSEAGFVKAALAESQGEFKRAVIFRLTWAGEDFASSILDDTLWTKAKGVVIKPAASWTFDVLKSYLSGEISRRVSLEALTPF